MAPHTLVNLKQVEDMAVKHGLGGQLESRFARNALGLERSGLTYFRFSPGFRTPFGHTHSEQEEVYVVLSGSARAKVEDEIVALAPLDALHVPPGTMRCLEAGPDGAELLAYGAPSTGRSDAEVVPGWWTD